MLNALIKNIGLFIVLLVLQLFVMNNIQFSGYVNPFIYILFILLLPFELASWILLIVSFILGLVLDLFSGTPGLHTSATVFAGFVRPYVLSIISPREGYETGDRPGIEAYGLRWFLIYLVIMVFLHHGVLFYLEVFRFDNFFHTLLRVLMSTGFSVLFIIIIQLLIIRR